jgi:hypothetical protein
MQKDFHYCMVRVLAEKAGFKPQEAQIIAYASQYVDDAVEFQEITVKGLPSLDYSRLSEEIFDPICTAHRGIQYIAGITKDAQRKVYLPFHFVPAAEYAGDGSYDFRTMPDGSLAGGIAHAAVLELKNAASENERMQKLIKLGIALHSFADTWAHQRFSGRLSHEDNDVERISIFKNGRWESLPFFEQVRANMFPEVGHVEAMQYPDFSRLRWRYEHGSSGSEYERDNASIFLDAAKAIFGLLCEAVGTTVEWEEHEARLKECLSMSPHSFREEFENYKRLFPDVSFSYHEEEWRSHALAGGRLNWTDFTENDYSEIEYGFNGDMKWFYFHIEALSQRMYVMDRIKSDLL